MNIDKQIARIVREWFPNHIADWRQSGLLDWAKPGNSNYRVRYIIDICTLLVWGDLGAAVYRWSSPITWEFLAGCDWQYFLEKCVASEMGRDFKQWDGGELSERVAECLRDRCPEMRKSKFARLIEACKGTANPQDWMNLAEREQPFNQDYWEMADWGFVPHCRGIGHWVGIKMAMKEPKFMAKYL